MRKMTINKNDSVVITDDDVEVNNFEFNANGGEPDIREAAHSAIDWAISILQASKESSVEIHENNTIYIQGDAK